MCVILSHERAREMADVCNFLKATREREIWQMCVILSHERAREMADVCNFKLRESARYGRCV